MIKNGRFFSLPDTSDDDFKSLFTRAAAAGIGRPVDSDGCPQGPWTPELLAEAISEIDANKAGIELRTVQLWFEDNDKGIGTSNIRWLARVLGCSDPEGASAWQTALRKSQARLMARRNARHEKAAGTSANYDAMPDTDLSKNLDADDLRQGLGLVHLTEAAFSRGSPLNLPAAVFAGAVALQFVSYFLSIHSVTYVQDSGITKQVGFIWAPNWTIVFLVLMPIFFVFVADQVTSWKNEWRATLLSYLGRQGQPGDWMDKVGSSSWTYWAAFVLCLGFAGVFQWVSVRLLPVLHGEGAFATDWGSLAYVRPDKFGAIEQAAFTGAAYFYMSLCFYLFIAGLVLLSNVADDFAQTIKHLARHSKAPPINTAQAVSMKIMRGVTRASIGGISIAMCMKLQSLYLTTDAPDIWQWLISDSSSVLTAIGSPVDWGNYSMPTHFTSLLVTLMVCTVYLYAVIRIGITPLFKVPLARPTSAILFLTLVYLLIGAVTGFSILLALSILASVYGLFDPGFRTCSKAQLGSQHVP